MLTSLMSIPDRDFFRKFLPIIFSAVALTIAAIGCLNADRHLRNFDGMSPVPSLRTFQIADRQEPQAPAESLRTPPAVVEVRPLSPPFCVTQDVIRLKSSDGNQILQIYVISDKVIITQADLKRGVARSMPLTVPDDKPDGTDQEKDDGTFDLKQEPKVTLIPPDKSEPNSSALLYEP